MLYHLLDLLTPGRHYAYENALFRAGLSALLCFLLVASCVPRLVRLLNRWDVGDDPEFDHDDLNTLMRGKTDVPTMGGVIIIFAVAVSTVLLADPSNFYVLMGLVCLVWLGGVGAVDDWLKLRSRRGRGGRDGLKSHEKLLFQIGLGAIIGFFAFDHGAENFAVAPVHDAVPAYSILTVPFYKPGIQLGAAAFIVITVLVMTATSNAVNLTDGMDGLASGCVATCSIVFVVLAYVAGTEPLATKLLVPYVPQSGELAVLCGGVLGATLGFLWHNCHPASIFMGDTGSLPLGGLIGYVAIVTRQELMLLIAGGVFVAEALSVIIQVGYFKLSGGRRVFRCAPIHHHFHLSGWTESQTVVRFWLLGAACAALALATIKLR